MILFDINHLFATVKWLQALLFNTNYSIPHDSFIYSQMVPSIAIL